MFLLFINLLVDNFDFMIVGSERHQQFFFFFLQLLNAI